MMMFYKVKEDTDIPRILQQQQEVYFCPPNLEN